jgi:cell division septation protein DedD
VTAHTHDDAFHEIQLNGKQLVFVFMTATIVSVVIFLIGVLVGRGVRVERAALAQAEALSESPTADVPPATPAVPESLVPAAGDPTAAAPPPTLDDLTYPKRLEESRPSAEALRPAAPRVAPVPTADRQPASTAPAASRPLAAEKSAVPSTPPKTVTPEAPPPPAEVASTVPAGTGYAVQVAALNVRGEAEAIAKRLSAKGYAAYVQAPAGGAPSVFRVRVGAFKTRREAETVASRLQREEQFKPWVTR